MKPLAPKWAVTVTRHQGKRCWCCCRPARWCTSSCSPIVSASAVSSAYSPPPPPPPPKLWPLLVCWSPPPPPSPVHWQSTLEAAEFQVPDEVKVRVGQGAAPHHGDGERAPGSGQGTKGSREHLQIRQDTATPAAATGTCYLSRRTIGCPVHDPNRCLQRRPPCPRSPARPGTSRSPCSSTRPCLEFDVAAADTAFQVMLEPPVVYPVPPPSSRHVGGRRRRAGAEADVSRGDRRSKRRRSEMAASRLVASCLVEHRHRSPPQPGKDA